MELNYLCTISKLVQEYVILYYSTCIQSAICRLGIHNVHARGMIMTWLYRYMTHIMISTDTMGTSTIISCTAQLSDSVWLL